MARRQDSDTIRVPIPLPYKGVNRAFARNLQPEGTTWKALNMVPFDRQGRRRPSQRGGAGRTDSLAAASPVRCLHVGSLVDTAGHFGTFASEPFTYSNGNLASVSAAGSLPWTTYTDFSSGTTTTATTAGMQVTSNKANASSTSLIGLAKLTTAPSLGSDYSVEADLTLNSWANTFRVGIACRYNAGATAGFILWLNNAGGTTRLQLITQAGTVVTPDSGDSPNVVVTVSSGSTYRVKALWTGNTVKGYIDGVLKFTSVVSANAANKGVGIAAQNSAAPTIDNFLVQGEGAAGAPINRTALKLVATSGTVVYVGEPGSMVAATDVATYPLDSASVFVSAATLFGFTYIVDGSGDPKKLQLSTNTMVAFTESAGTVVQNATIAAAWRGRLLLSGIEAEPQNIYASALGDPLDWDTGVSPATESMAWALNLSTLGLVGQPIHALMPISDDVCLVGCEQSLWIIRGDLAANGSVDNISETVGVLNQNAWCRGPDGSVFFLGPNGLYKCAPDGTGLTEISRDTYPQFFTAFDRSLTYTSLVFDPGRYGIWIFLAPTDSADAPIESMFYDLVATGFWPQEFTNYAGVGPVSAVMWDAFDSTERYPVLGGYTGQVSAISYTNRYDYDGTNNNAIESELWFGPFSISSVDDSIFTRLDITGGEVLTGDAASVWNVNWNVRGGITAYDVMDGTSAVSAAGNIASSGRFNTEYPRIRGGFFTLELSNTVAGNYFSLEDIVGHFVPAGRQRA